MSREPSSELSVQALLDDAKELPRQPEVVRARVLARARATAAAPPPVTNVPVNYARLAPQLVGAAAAAALVGSIVGTVLALSGAWSRREPAVVPAPTAVQSQPVSAPSAVQASAAPSVGPPASGSVAMEPSRPAADAPARVTPPAKTRREDAQASYNAELELMRSAHTAYAAHDYTGALVLVGEHARRFPGGLLSEEREALRVRCLLGAGRKSQARVAAESFAARFPRSVLVHRLEAEVGAGAQ